MYISILLIIAATIEISRMILIGRDIRDIAHSKGEQPRKWILGAISIWIGIELSVFGVWLYFIEGYLLIGGLILGILIARIVYFFYKRLLTQKPDRNYEQMIDEIGKSQERD